MPSGDESEGGADDCACAGEQKTSANVIAITPVLKFAAFNPHRAFRNFYGDGK
jgi:hypothetical protein